MIRSPVHEESRGLAQIPRGQDGESVFLDLLLVEFQEELVVNDEEDAFGIHTGGLLGCGGLWVRIFNPMRRKDRAAARAIFR